MSSPIVKCSGVAASPIIQEPVVKVKDLHADLKKFFCLNKTACFFSFIHLEVDKTILS
jgi:hypothetical protein